MPSSRSGNKLFNNAESAQTFFSSCFVSTTLSRERRIDFVLHQIRNYSHVVLFCDENNSIVSTRWSRVELNYSNLILTIDRFVLNACFHCVLINLIAKWRLMSIHLFNCAYSTWRKRNEREREKEKERTFPTQFLIHSFFFFLHLNSFTFNQQTIWINHSPMNPSVPLKIVCIQRIIYFSNISARFIFVS